MRRGAPVVFCLWLLAAACGDRREDDAVPPCAGDDCKVVFDNNCNDVSIALAGGGCRQVGVPSDGCAPGFTFDAARATCEPVLPAEPCADGTMAIPGDAACHPIAECGTDKWGTIPVESSTLYVDATSTALPADGTRERPFSRITDAITRAGGNAMIAIAAGRYNEDLTIRSGVRLWGRCPQMVTIAGVLTGRPAIHGSEVPEIGIESSLIEHNARAGASLFGATGSFRRVAFRCNAFDLYGTNLVPTEGLEHAYTLNDKGGNACGCEAATTCRAATAQLKPIDR